MLRDLRVDSLDAKIDRDDVRRLPKDTPRGATLDLKSPRGLELVQALLRKADVTVENMAPGTIERLGLGYDVVKALNPGIIHCSVQGFGAGSPYEKGLAFAT